jgi:hypothetical protein
MGNYIKVKLSDFQRENLEKLSDYLLSGELRAYFTMETFAGSFVKEYDIICGPVGDAVGHGPYAGVEKLEEEDWVEYSWRAFIDYSSTESSYWAWDWVFSFLWSKIDNSAKGAGQRIKILLEKGLPDNWYEQMIGFAGLEYET